MKPSKKIMFICIVLVAIFVISAFGYTLITQKGPCDNLLGGGKILKTKLSPITFDGIVKYLLPSPFRNPNAVYVAPDGSAWFAEQTTPGVGHIFQNGTLVEYAWPFSYSVPPDVSQTAQTCVSKTETWGITFWNGRVWATDSTGNQLVGLDPATGDVQTVKVSGNISFPYTLTVSPTGSLWFTELYNGKIGSLDQTGKLLEYSIPKGLNSVPSEIVFANTTLAYYVDVGEAGAGNGAVYAFNPQNVAPRQIAQGKKLTEPTSIALGGGGVWLTLHEASDLAFYNLTQRVWVTYPTSTIPYASTILPYFVKANGSLIWFNEHYGDKLARINFRDGSLTEFSLSNPPVSNGTQIPNALTFGLGNRNIWFVQWTANYVGYLKASYRPPFSTSLLGNRTIQLLPGGNQTMNVSVNGTSRDALTLRFSDSESPSAQPDLLNFVASTSTIHSLDGGMVIRVTVTAARNVAPGRYTALITTSDGHESSSAYVTIVVA